MHTCTPASFCLCVQEHPGNIMRAHFGRYRDFGLYTDSLAGYGSRMYYYVWDVPIFCVMGAMGGLLGALWVHLNVNITALRHRYVPVRCSAAAPKCRLKKHATASESICS